MRVVLADALSERQGLGRGRTHPGHAVPVAQGGEEPAVDQPRELQAVLSAVGECGRHGPQALVGPGQIAGLQEPGILEPSGGDQVRGTGNNHIAGSYYFKVSVVWVRSGEVIRVSSKDPVIDNRGIVLDQVAALPRPEVRVPSPFAWPAVSKVAFVAIRKLAILPATSGSSPTAIAPA